MLPAVLPLNQATTTATARATAKRSRTSMAADIDAADIIVGHLSWGSWQGGDNPTDNSMSKAAADALRNQLELTHLRHVVARNE